MNKRKLGLTSLEVSPLTFGANVFGWTVDEPTAFMLLDFYIEAGGNFIDTADMYSSWAPGNKGGESETIIGKWLKRRGTRKDVIIATKVGMPMGNKKGLSKTYICRAVEDSLNRLQTDYIDLYQSHIDDAETPLEETLEAYSQLLKQGKVRTIGASNYSAARLERALSLANEKSLPRYQTLQPHYNLYNRSEFEAELEPLCTEYGLGVITYYSLASGFLTGKYRSESDFNKSARGCGMIKYLTPRGHRILAALDLLAREKGATPAQVALSWLMARPSVTSAIASATNLAQLGELTAATELTLNPADITLLNQASVNA